MASFLKDIFDNLAVEFRLQRYFINTDVFKEGHRVWNIGRYFVFICIDFRSDG